MDVLKRHNLLFFVIFLSWCYLLNVWYRMNLFCVCDFSKSVLKSVPFNKLFLIFYRDLCGSQLIKRFNNNLVSYLDKYGQFSLLIVLSLYKHCHFTFNQCLNQITDYVY